MRLKVLVAASCLSLFSSSLAALELQEEEAEILGSMVGSASGCLPHLSQEALQSFDIFIDVVSVWRENNTENEAFFRGVADGQDKSQDEFSCRILGLYYVGFITAIKIDE